MKSLAEMYDSHSQSDETCRHNVDRLSSLLHDYKQRLPAFIDEIDRMGSQDFQHMSVKLFSEINYPEGDNRIIDVRTDISLLELFF